METEIRDFGPITYEGFDLSGQYEFEPGARETRDEPGYGHIVTVIAVFIDGDSKDAIELVDPKVNHWLEDKIADSLPAVGEADYDENAADEWRFEQREAA